MASKPIVCRLSELPPGARRVITAGGRSIGVLNVDGALYALRGAACGRCNTAIPLQRRNVMAAGRSVEVCEGCGVLLYAAV